MTIRACFMACSGLAALLLALAPTPGLAATTNAGCGHANLNNPGHHYGLIKNGCLRPPTPPPTPLPIPQPTAIPTPHSSPAPILRPAQPIAQVRPSSSPVRAVMPADTAPAPLNLTSPPVVANPAVATAQASDHSVWTWIGLVGSALLLLLLIALATTTYLRRRLRAAATPAQ